MGGAMIIFDVTFVIEQRLLNIDDWSADCKYKKAFRRRFEGVGGELVTVERRYVITEIWFAFPSLLTMLETGTRRLRAVVESRQKEKPRRTRAPTIKHTLSCGLEKPYCFHDWQVCSLNKWQPEIQGMTSNTSSQIRRSLKCWTLF